MIGELNKQQQQQRRQGRLFLGEQVNVTNSSNNISADNRGKNNQGKERRQERLTVPRASARRWGPWRRWRRPARSGTSVSPGGRADAGVDPVDHALLAVEKRRAGVDGRVRHGPAAELVHAPHSERNLCYRVVMVRLLQRRLVQLVAEEEGRGGAWLGVGLSFRGAAHNK